MSPSKYFAPATPLKYHHPRDKTIIRLVLILLKTPLQKSFHHFNKKGILYIGHALLKQH